MMFLVLRRTTFTVSSEIFFQFSLSICISAQCSSYWLFDCFRAGIFIPIKITELALYQISRCERFELLTFNPPHKGLDPIYSMAAASSQSKTHRSASIYSAAYPTVSIAKHVSST